MKTNDKTCWKQFNICHLLISGRERIYNIFGSALLNNQITKAYYLPASRTIIAGIILVLIGLSPIYRVMLIDHSVNAGFQFILETFTGFPEIILGVMCLVILLSGVLYLKNARKIIRLKLDEKGIYYMPFAEGNPSKYKPLFNLFFLKEALKFIAHNDIASAEFEVDKWRGNSVNIKLKNGETRRLLAAPFTLADKKEVVSIINNSIHGRNKG